MLTSEERDRIVEEEALRFHTRRKLELHEQVKRWLLITLLVSLVTGSVIFLVMKERRCWFQKGVTVSTMVDSASSLRAWTDVRCLGIRVGTLQKIKVNTTNGETHPIELKIFILSANDMTRKIRSDSEVRVVDPVFGPAYLDIKPGSSELPEVQENDILKPSPPSTKESVRDWLGSFVNNR